MTLPIQNNSDQFRFETTVDGELCVLDYSIREQVITMHRVFVPPPVEGRGIAGHLTRHALDWTRERGLKVVPRCPYVAAWIQRNPEYRDLVIT